MRRIIVLVLFVLILGLQGCANRIVITDEDILAEGDSYRFLKRELTGDENYFEIEFSGFNGIQTIWKLESNESSQMTITWDCHITKGEYKILFLTPDQEIINLLDYENSFTYSLSTGNYRIKILGLNGKGNCNVSLDVDNSVKVQFYKD